MRNQVNHLGPLQPRKDAGVDAFAVLSCDNIPHNGNVVRGAVVGFAGMKDKELADWISEKVQFPNSMVDCITPATSDREGKFVFDEFGLQGDQPIFCQPFRQWVMEDFQPPPAFKRVSVEFVEDVTPYERMKIHILNGGHASLCYPSSLLGLEYVHESMDHPTIGPFLDALEHTEILPGVGSVPNDSKWDELQATALRVREDHSAWIGMKDVYGDVGENEVFAKCFADALKMVQEEGVETLLKKVE